jgi:prefoldin subunit 5
MARRLLPIGPVFWLDVGAEATSMETLVAQLSALIQVAEELDARMMGEGVGGLEGAAAICERLRAVLDGIVPADLELMMRRVAELETELAEVAGRLAAVRELKALLERIEPPE